MWSACSPSTGWGREALAAPHSGEKNHTTIIIPLLKMVVDLNECKTCIALTLLPTAPRRARVHGQVNQAIQPNHFLANRKKKSH